MYEGKKQTNFIFCSETTKWKTEKTYVVINIQKNIKRHDFVNLGSKAVFDPFKAQICEARGVVLTSRAFSLSQVVVSIHIWLCAKIT